MTVVEDDVAEAGAMTSSSPFVIFVIGEEVPVGSGVVSSVPFETSARMKATGKPANIRATAKTAVHDVMCDLSMCEKCIVKVPLHCNEVNVLLFTCCTQVIQLGLTWINKKRPELESSLVASKQSGQMLLRRRVVERRRCRAIQTVISLQVSRRLDP